MAETFQSREDLVVLLAVGEVLFAVNGYVVLVVCHKFLVDSGCYIYYFESDLSGTSSMAFSL